MIGSSKDSTVLNTSADEARREREQAVKDDSSVEQEPKPAAHAEDDLKEEGVDRSSNAANTAHPAG